MVSNPNLQINTNPVEIYKTWINQLEMNTGQPRFVSIIFPWVLCVSSLARRDARDIIRLKATKLPFYN